MSGQTVAAVASLIDGEPALLPILEEHLDSNFNEILPHVLLSSVVFWVVAHRVEYPELLAKLIGWMSRTVESPFQDVRELAVASGIEMFPYPGEPGGDLRSAFPENLRRFA